MSSVLLPLLEGRPLELNGRGEIEMGKGGQIIATTRCQFPVFQSNDRLVSGAKSAQVENMLGIQRWSRVTVIPPTDTDLFEIITSSLPRIHFIVPVLLQVYTSLRELYNDPTIKSSRRLSTRDLLKWTKRTALLCSNVTGESIPRETWDDIFLEAVDCFAAMIPSLPSRRIIIENIGTEMGFPRERVRLYIENHSPTLLDDSRAVKIGLLMSVNKRNRVIYLVDLNLLIHVPLQFNLKKILKRYLKGRFLYDGMKRFCREFLNVILRKSGLGL